MNKMADQNEMEKIVTPMMEHLCDHLCRFPWEIERKEDLEEVCAGCQMDKYTNDILNTYNQVNDFQNTQCIKLLKELAEEQEKQRWIPVKERLPEIDEIVVVTNRTGDVDADHLESSGEWFWEGEVSNVIAWMPLPEKYQKSDKGDIE